MREPEFSWERYVQTNDDVGPFSDFDDTEWNEYEDMFSTYDPDDYELKQQF